MCTVSSKAFSFTILCGKMSIELRDSLHYSLISVRPTTIELAHRVSHLSGLVIALMFGLNKEELSCDFI